MEMAIEVVRIAGFDVTVWLHTDVDPPDHEWNVAVAMILARLDAGRMSRDRLRGFVISDGASPDLKQRSQLHGEIYAGLESPSSVVTTVLSNPMKRGVATAIRWLNPRFGFFPPEEIDRALAHVDLAKELPALWDVYARLQLRLRTVKTLGLIARMKGLRPLQPADL